MSMPDHAKPPGRRDHLWVLFIIAACALLELVASWVTIGAMSGFPRIGGKLPTDWTLAVAAEAYWGYALYAWLAASPGPRSRRFAMWSAGVVFILSLAGQGAAHLVKPGTQPSPVLVVFVTSLPVIVLALIAILIHLRQTDREEIAANERRAAAAERQAAAERAEADERTALRAQLEALAARVAEAETARDDAAQRAAQAEAKTAQLERRMAAQTGAKGARKPGAKKAAGSPRKGTSAERETELPDDFDAQTEALRILAAEPGISGAELGPRVNRSKRWGQTFKGKLAKAAPKGPDAEDEQ